MPNFKDLKKRLGQVFGARYDAFFCSTVLALGYSLTAVSQTSKSFPNPQKTLLLIGGGGEREDKKNQFDHSLEAASALINRGWQARIVYDTDHPTSSETIKKYKLRERAKSISPFTDADLASELQNLESELASSQSSWRPGDQILISVATHGSLDEMGNHVISTSNGTTKIVDNLKRLIRLAEAKGLKVGLSLQSCFSGDAVNEIQRAITRPETTCLIATSAPGRISYGSFNSDDNLINKIAYSKTLEAGFLSFRDSESTLETVPHIPAISSPAGAYAMAGAREISKLIVPKEQSSDPVLSCFDPKRHLFPGVSFAKEDLRSIAGKLFLQEKRLFGLKPSSAARIKELRDKKDALDIEIYMNNSFPGNSWATCHNSIVDLDVSKLRKDFLEVLESNPMKNLDPKLRAREIGIYAFSDRDFKFTLCSAIFNSDGLLNISGELHRLTALERKRRTILANGGPVSNIGLTPPPTPAPIIRTIIDPDMPPTPVLEEEEISTFINEKPQHSQLTPVTYIDERIERQKRRIQTMQEIWRSSKIRRLLEQARKKRNIINGLLDDRAKLEEQLRSPETVAAEREAWLQLYNSFKQKNPQAKDPCADFAI